MTQTLFVKHFGALRPANPDAEALLAKLKQDKLVMVEVKRSRNLFHHRKFFALMQLVYENQTAYATVDDIVMAFKFAVSHTRKIKTGRGVIEIPLSISFAAMDQTEFEAFYNRAMDFLVTEVLPGVNSADLEREVYDVIGMTDASGAEMTQLSGG